MSAANPPTTSAAERSNNVAARCCFWLWRPIAPHQQKLNYARNFWRLPALGFFVAAVAAAIVAPLYFLVYRPSVQQVRDEPVRGAWIKAKPNNTTGLLYSAGVNPVGHIQNYTKWANETYGVQDFYYVIISVDSTSNPNGMVMPGALRVFLGAKGKMAYGDYHQPLMVPALMIPLVHYTNDSNNEYSYPYMFGYSKRFLWLKVGNTQEFAYNYGDALPIVRTAPYDFNTSVYPGLYPLDRYTAKFHVYLAWRNISNRHLWDDAPWAVLLSEASPHYSVRAVSVTAEHREFMIDNNGPDTTAQITENIVAIVDLEVTRSGSTKALAIIVAILSWLLSLALMTMALDFSFLRIRKPEAGLIAAAMALLFALPQLRNNLPGIPPVGIAYDVVVYIPAICLTSLAALTFMCSYFGYKEEDKTVKIAADSASNDNGSGGQGPSPDPTPTTQNQGGQEPRQPEERQEGSGPPSSSSSDRASSASTRSHLVSEFRRRLSCASPTEQTVESV